MCSRLWASIRACVCVYCTWSVCECACMSVCGWSVCLCVCNTRVRICECVSCVCVFTVLVSLQPLAVLHDRVVGITVSNKTISSLQEPVNITFPLPCPADQSVTTTTLYQSQAETDIQFSTDLPFVPNCILLICVCVLDGNKCFLFLSIFKFLWQQ